MYINTWYHIAVVRQGGSEWIFINGVPQTLTYDTDPGSSVSWSASTSSVFKVGANYYGNNVAGWIDELRVSKGVARWTADFSASLPTEEYSASFDNTVIAALVTATGALQAPTISIPLTISVVLLI